MRNPIAIGARAVTREQKPATSDKTSAVTSASAQPPKTRIPRLTKLALVAAGLYYAPIANAVFSSLFFDTNTAAVKTYMSLRQDGSTLAALGISPELVNTILSDQASGRVLTQQQIQLLDAPITYSTLQSDPYQVCEGRLYGHAHALSIVVLVIYLLGLPVVSLVSLTDIFRLHYIHAAVPPTSKATQHPDPNGLLQRACACLTFVRVQRFLSRIDALVTLKADDAVLDYFIGDFRNSHFYSRHVNFASSLVLAIVALAPVFSGSASGIIGTCVLTCVFPCWKIFEWAFLNPYRPEERWKGNVEVCVSLVLTLMAVLNALQGTADLATQGASVPFTPSPTGLLVMSLVTFAATIVLFVVLIAAFLFSLVDGAKTESTVQSSALTDTSQAKSAPALAQEHLTIDNPMAATTGSALSKSLRVVVDAQHSAAAATSFQPVPASARRRQSAAQAFLPRQASQLRTSRRRQADTDDVHRLRSTA